MNERDSWEVWKKLVLADLKRLETTQRDTVILLQNMEIQLAKLQVKSSVWGFLAGSVPVGMMILVDLIKKGKL